MNTDFNWFEVMDEVTKKPKKTPVKNLFKKIFKRKKTLYVPDPEILEYINNKNVAETLESPNGENVTEVEKVLESTAVEETAKTPEEIIKKIIADLAVPTNTDSASDATEVIAEEAAVSAFDNSDKEIIPDNADAVADESTTAVVEEMPAEAIDETTPDDFSILAEEIVVEAAEVAQTEVIDEVADETIIEEPAFEVAFESVNETETVVNETIPEECDEAQPDDKESDKTPTILNTVNSVTNKLSPVVLKIKTLFFKLFVPKKGDTKKQLIVKIVSIILALTILASIGYLAFYYVELHNVRTTIKNVQSLYQLNRYDTSYNADGQFSKFDALKAQNDDIVGWLNIPNTDIDNPIYQADDNEFYINHDINKDTNRYGTLFLDYRCKIHPLKLTNNLIVYGHNMREGAMLGTLDKYRELSFYKENPVIHFDTLYEQKRYKIFAIMVVSNEEDNTFGYPFSPYRPSFSSRDEFMSWIKHCKERSLFDIEVDIDAYDQIITLSTCSYDFTDARLVVMGRLVREGENESVDTSSAKRNANVLYPKAWYDKKKKPIPTV